jgi:UDPglucose--hexose-1-phosphate uridylyltransferase
VDNLVQPVARPRVALLGGPPDLGDIARRRPATKTEATLSDGRHIVFYDETARLGGRTVEDERSLPPPPSGSDLRFDPVRAEWVIVAGHRQDRSYRPKTQDCPLCPSRPGWPTEVPAQDYDVVVFENRFPALSGAGCAPASIVPANAEQLTDGLHMAPGVGRCEVVCFTSEHRGSFAQLPESRIRTMVDVWTDRSVAMSQLPEVEQVFCFENRGAEIGVTLEHPHGQIYGYPFVTPRTARMIANAQAHRERRGTNLFEDILAWELEDGRRIVLEGRSWVAFVPFAARWPYEVHLFPLRRVPDLAALDDEAKDEFPTLCARLLQGFDRLFDGPAPYIAAWHQAPVRRGRRDFALHLELFTIRRAADRLKYLAGSESAMGAFANDVVPEIAAERLRASMGGPG